MACLGACLLLGLVSLGSAQACSPNGRLSALAHYAGSQDGDFPTTLYGEPAVQARLQRLPPTVLTHLQRNLEVRGPVDLVACELVLSGNAAHMGGVENAILDVNLYSGAVTAALLSRGQITIYLDRDPTAGSGYSAVPISVRRWAVSAATGFRAAEHPPPGTQIVRPETE